MLSVLEQLGYDVDALLSSAGLHREEAEDPYAYLSPSAYAALFAEALEERRVQNLPLKLALRTPVGPSDMLDYLIVSSESVGQGLHRVARYLRLVNPGIRVQVEDSHDPVRVVVERSAGDFEAELTVSLSMLRFRRETNDLLKPTHASFAHEPDDVEEYERVLQCPVRARASWTGWALSKDDFGLPLRQRDLPLRRMLEKQAADMLDRLPASGDVRDDVRSVLAALTTFGDMTIEIVAARLGTTTRTLRRRLARTGTSFDTLRDEARRLAAEAYLAETKLTIGEVAFLLGYSEPTAFHRAFKRWHGTTPQTFRDRSAP
jgi:AraC-like DNA-binding protein